VATQILQMIRQLGPMVRFDGYHVLADITGVPDLYSRIKPTLLGALPWRWGDPHARMLKPWARVLVTVWVLVVVPLLLCTLATTIITLPRLVGTALSALGKQQTVLVSAWSDGDVLQVTARVLAIVAILIPVAGVAYMMVRITRQSAAGAWRATTGKPVRRIAAMLLGATVAAGIAYAWWPGDGKYQPIQPWERGTIGDIAYALKVDRTPRHAATASRPLAASTRLVNGRRGEMLSVWDTRTPPPTFTQPQLAVILVPKMPSGAATGGGGNSVTVAPHETSDSGWVFPVSKPLVPGPGDTQALAVNTTDGTVDYEAAFAMVWVDPNSDAMNVNEAHAYASCESCAAVAVAYQVVFVIDTDETDNNVAAPQNLAGALNYNCTNCLTYALAQQLFVTLDRPLTDEEQQRLDAVWAKVQELQSQINDGELTLDQIDTIDDQLAGYSAEIKQIVAPAMATSTAPSTVVQTASQTSPSTASSTPSPTATPTPSATQSSTPAATPTPSASASASPTSSPAPTSAASPTASSSPTTRASTPTASNTSDPSAPVGSTSGTSTGSTTGGSDTAGSTSGGSASGGSASSP
jgi:putative peptide zinc metalloprotease protein